MKTRPKCLVESVLDVSPSRPSARRSLAEMALGIVAAIQHRMPVEEATRDLFTLDNYLALRRNRLGKDLLDLFEWGMQLEDVVEIVPGPDALDESLRSIVRIAHMVLVFPQFEVKKPRRMRGRLRDSGQSREAGTFHFVLPKGVRRACPRHRISAGR